MRRLRQRKPRMSEPDIPPEWWGDTFKTWAVLNAGRQDDEMKRLAADLAIVKEKLDGKAARDIDAAHKCIRQLSSQSDELRKKVTYNVMTTVLIFVGVILVVLLFATIFPIH